MIDFHVARLERTEWAAREQLVRTSHRDYLMRERLTLKGNLLRETADFHHPLADGSQEANYPWLSVLVSRVT